MYSEKHVCLDIKRIFSPDSVSHHSPTLQSSTEWRVVTNPRPVPWWPRAPRRGSDQISGLMEDVSRLFQSRTMIRAEIVTSITRDYRTILLGWEKELGVAMMFVARQGRVFPPPVLLLRQGVEDELRQWLWCMTVVVVVMMMCVLMVVVMLCGDDMCLRQDNRIKNIST